VEGGPEREWREGDNEGKRAGAWGERGRVVAFESEREGGAEMSENETLTTVYIQ
jgi:hypothetical protein